MGYLACTFSQMKSINMFSVFLQSGVTRHFLWRFIVVWIYNLTVFMFMYVSVEKQGCLGCFHAASARENISWVWEIQLETTSPLPVGWYGYAWNDYQSSLLAAGEKNHSILRLFFKTKFHSEMIFLSNVPNQTLILKNKAHQFQLFFSHQRASIANGLFLNTQCSTWTFHGAFCIPILRLLGHTQFQNGCKSFYSSKV